MHLMSGLGCACVIIITFPVKSELKCTQDQINYFIMISVNNYGDIFSPWLVSMEMAAILNFMALIKVHIHTFKTASSTAMKSCTHIEDINYE